jgi:hypothetical protein
LLQRAATFNHQRIHDRIFKRAGDIGAGLLVVAVAANGVRGKGLQAGEAEIQPGRSVIGRGKTKRPSVPWDAIFDSIGPPG